MRRPPLPIKKYDIEIFIFDIFHKCNYIFFSACSIEYRYGLFLNGDPSAVLSTTTVASPEACYQACSVKWFCYNFTYDTSTHKCILFKSLDWSAVSSTNANYVSGVLVCGYA
jgi:hypothetical protein